MEKLTGQTILDFQQGDRRAFALVFRAYYAIVVIFGEKITGNQDEAEEIV